MRPLADGVYSLPMSKTKVDKVTPGSLVISETSTSTWHYHLRRVGADGRLFLGGGAPPAICGRAVGWDTKQPIANWGKKSHLNESFCSDCNDVAHDELVKTALLPAMDIAKKGMKPDGWVATPSFSGLKTLVGRPRHKTCGAAAKAALEDLRGLDDKPLRDGMTFLVGRVMKSVSYANGCFTEVFVLGEVATYKVVKGIAKKVK